MYGRSPALTTPRHVHRAWGVCVWNSAPVIRGHGLPEALMLACPVGSAQWSGFLASSSAQHEAGRGRYGVHRRCPNGGLMVVDPLLILPKGARRPHGFFVDATRAGSGP